MDFETWLKTTDKPLPTLPGGQAIDVIKAITIWVDEEMEPVRQALANRNKEVPA